MVLAAKDFVSVDLSSVFFLIRKVPYIAYLTADERKQENMTLLDNNNSICKWSWKWRKRSSHYKASRAQIVLINRVVVYTRFKQNVHWLL